MGGTRLSTWLGIGLLWALAPRSTADIYGGAVVPVERTFLAKPTLSWSVFSTGSDQIASGQITLNGDPILARYDRATQCVVGTPAQALAPGEYKVVARAVFERGFALTQEWSFEVLGNALTALPAPTDEQRQVVSLINALRERMALPPAEIDASLCMAAQKHTVFNDLNKTTGHYERSHMPGFVGQGPAERTQAFGYRGDTYEAVNFGSRSPEEAIQNLIDAPYHRIPFLQPGELLVGTGLVGERLTVDFQLNGASGVVVYPFDGQRDVPCGWGKLERPNPLRLHPKAIGVVGYPVTLVCYGKDVQLTDVRAELRTESGEQVPAYVNSPENDTWLRNGVILMAEKPLTPATTYVAEFSAKDSDGRGISRTWKFTTAAPKSPAVLVARKG